MDPIINGRSWKCTEVRGIENGIVVATARRYRNGPQWKLRGDGWMKLVGGAELAVAAMRDLICGRVEWTIRHSSGERAIMPMVA